MTSTNGTNGTIERDVRQFLADNFPLSTEGFELDANESLIESGVIDSTGVLELIEFLEERYQLQIPDADVLPENLDSIAGIGRYVAGRS